MSSFTLEWTRTFKAHQLFSPLLFYYRGYIHRDPLVSITSEKHRRRRHFWPFFSLSRSIVSSRLSKFLY
jgi:hypothetical protein